jgi:glycosyltransferase involved in cell wall biosynthesis
MTAGRRRARILFVQPSFQPPGGGNSVAAWMLQSLVAEHDVTVLTWEPLRLDAVNRFYGTALRRDDVRAEAVHPLARRAIEAFPTSMALMRTAVLSSAARRRAAAFDLTVTAHNEAEFGRPNIQYIHYPGYRRPRPLTDVRWYHPAIALDAYYWFADRLLNTSREQLVASRTLTNSDWTGAAFVRLHGGRTETLYPPIVATLPGVAWEAREPGFVCLGRLVPEKRIEQVLEIVEAVHRVRPAAHLHVVGSRGRGSYSRGLMRRLRRLAWVTVHEDISRDDVVRVIAQHRFGLHAMIDEHFGMAPADMVCGGCLVWMHDSGGQVEIVERDPRFLYTDADEAVRKILAMWDDPAAQASARAQFSGARERFSVARFQARVRAIVAEMLDARTLMR